MRGQGHKVGAAIGAAGGLIGVVDALLSDPEGKANREIVRKNTETLERLRQDLAGFSEGTIEQLLKGADAIANSAIIQATAATQFAAKGFKSVEVLDKELRAAGSSIALLKRQAEDLGITIVDAKGRITAAGLIFLDEKSRLAALALARFDDSLNDFTFLQGARGDIFDIEGAQESFNGVVAVFRKFTGGLGAGLEGIDITTKEGRERAEAEIRRLYELASKNLIPKELLKGLSAEEFVRRLVDADNALDTFAETAKKAAGEMVNIAEGFAVNRRVFQAIIAGTATTGRGAIRTGAPPAPASTPGLAPRPAPVPLSLTFDMSGMQVINAAGDTPEQLRQKIRRASIDKARTISPQAVAAVQAVFPA